MATKIEQLLSAKQPALSVWLFFSLLIPIYFGLISFRHAIALPYLIQDDMRQHVVWLQTFVDPQLFPNDLIANYFKTLAPIGYKATYYLMAKLGVEPISLAKALPVILGSITSFYFFKSYLYLLPYPAGAFLATLILNQNIWLKDDLISATPRAFIYPFFAAFLFYLLKRSLIPCLIAIALLGLFFPQLVLVEIAVLTIRLFGWRDGWIRLSQKSLDYRLWLFGLCVASIVIIPFVFNTSQVGDRIAVAQMQVISEFGLKGRSQYFGVSPLNFLFAGSSGIRFPLFPPIIWFGLGLPFVLRSKLILAKSVTDRIVILPQLVLGSIGVFLLAHVLFFRLYFPSRYTYHTLRFIMAMSAGIVVFILLHRGYDWLRKRLQGQHKLKIKEGISVGLIGMFAIASLIVPALPSVFLKSHLWRMGEYPQIYTFLASQPKDIIVASIDDAADNIPAFSHRSVLASQEFAFAYHPNYYQPFQQRAIDTVRAQYSPDISEVKSIISKYGIDFFLVDREAFSAGYLLSQRWLTHSSFSDVVVDVATQLSEGSRPALAKLSEVCEVASEGNLRVLSASCMVRSE
ncbi:hypothetical protein [Synechococcus sp. PCC 7336]|uniref:hypothetical protein n=1 Tax=Synechococcus sp. PCC 7336 TaxID=195250 RepID=UPI0003475E4D|nr:hypothetical protein [Synechococcus sp. PCC 7336]